MFLFVVLAISTFIGIFFNTLIVELLFERGAFTIKDTETTSLVLVMYMIGLLPFGLGKIFSLWLYSYEKQAIAAKITMKSLFGKYHTFFTFHRTLWSVWIGVWQVV